MGRREAPVDYTVPELGELAARLRALRAAANLTYAKLADLTNYSAATLKRAAAGKTLPAYSTACAYAAACDGPVEETVTLYRLAEDAVAGRALDARRIQVLPKPQFARDRADLSGALRDAYRRAGQPSLRAMEGRAREGQLPRSSVHNIVTGRALPADIGQYVAFLQACEISGQALGPWFGAWLKVCGRPHFHHHPYSRRPALSGAEQLFLEWMTSAPGLATELNLAEAQVVVDDKHKIQGLTWPSGFSLPATFTPQLVA
ncbi:hypothetical protein ADK76_08535 [Streptomyces griseoflavus]|uniref:helix-turn-helix domain-containing protein n=1 Tax=Streptomyces rimosus TaxID=1927 RepID=UPI0004CC48BE|nr:helix-turn-helix domain-containing protein [Streptomyces rimosus]KOG64702.1 hypothetical protein ADK76_08535 [Streptomyces griseoflavus]